jgi:succinate-semialdehyde dehydrogenase/glutarate-semialdehyde dehydrogenase
MEPDTDNATHLGTGATPAGIDQGLIDPLAASASVAPGSEPIAVRAPFSGRLLARRPRGSPSDVAGAAARARSAQPGWAALGAAGRARILLRFHASLLDRQEEALDLIQLETGKARWHAIEEVMYVAVATRHYALHGERYLRTRRRRVAFPFFTLAWEHRHPVGLVGIISPWNFPLVLGAGDLLPALMAGNAVLLRPDEQSSLTALWVAERLRDAGLPDGVLQVVTGEGPVLGPALVDAVDYLMFTGSTKTGRIVARQAADRLIGCSLELGGKNPMLVLDDADLERAVDGAVRGAFVGAGQVCVSLERAFIDRRIYGRFVERLVERVRTMRLSSALEYGPDMGSLTVPRQLETVKAHVADALEKGATLLAGGRARPDLGPLFYEPTLLANVTPDMRVWGEETFGPVLSLYPFTDLDHAIRAANDTAFGLNASVWSGNRPRAFDVARRLQAGTVNINESYASTWAAIGAPMGGMKESGRGRRQGAEGILKYTEAQTVTVQRGLALVPAPAAIGEPRWARALNLFLRASRYIPRLR